MCQKPGYLYKKFIKRKVQSKEQIYGPYYSVKHRVKGREVWHYIGRMGTA
jgi:hypothetical protein